MDKVAEQFFIDRRAREIWSHCVWSRKFVRYLDPREVEDILANAEPEVFINAEGDKLAAVPQREVSFLWKSRLQGHVVENPEDFDPGDFKDGCCYLAELWKAKGGGSVLVLSYHH